MRFTKLQERATIPTRATRASAGYDLKCLDGFTIMPKQRVLVPTGLTVLNMPAYLFGSIRDKSGLAYKYGITTLAGVIDSDYTGDIGVVLLNTGKDPVTFKAGQAVAQLVIEDFFTMDNEAEVTEERAGGFGSTNA